MAWLSKKTCKVGGDGIQQINQLLAGLFLNDVLVVVTEGFKLAFADSFSKPGLEQFFFPVMEIDSALVINQSANLLKICVGQFNIAGNGEIGMQWSGSLPFLGLPIYLKQTSTTKLPPRVPKGIERMGPLVMCFTSCPGPETTDGIEP